MPRLLFIFAALGLLSCASRNHTASTDGDNPNTRHPAQTASMPGFSPTIRLTPFFIEAYPKPVDARTGDLNATPVPISAEALQAIVRDGMAPLMASLSGVYLSGPKPPEELLMITAQHLQVAVMEVLKKVDAQLTDEDLEYSFVLMPWKLTDPFEYTSSGVQVTGRVLGTAAFGKPNNFYSEVINNLKEVQNGASQSQAPAYMLGSITNIHLKKGQSSIKTQFVIGLNPREIPFVQANEKVNITHVVIPAPTQAFGPTVMSFELNQSVSAEGGRPTAHVEFGPQLNWQPDPKTLRVNVRGDGFACASRNGGTPYLKGTLGAQAMPGKAWPAGTQVNFNLPDMDLDLVSQRVTNMNLRVGVGFSVLGTRLMGLCLSVGSVNQEFQSEVNKAIQAEVERLQLNDPAQLLKTILNRQGQAQ